MLKIYNNNFGHLYRQLGFTLIELLVTVAITLVLLSGAIAFFLDYLDQRNVSDAVDELKTIFQRASSEANAGNLNGCEQLNGYKITSAQSGNVTTIFLQADCTVGTATEATEYQLANGVVISPNLDVTFRVLHAGVDLPGGVASQEITVTNDSHSYAFTLYREGRFSPGGWL